MSLEAGGSISCRPNPAATLLVGFSVREYVFYVFLNEKNAFLRFLENDMSKNAENVIKVFPLRSLSNR